jgi:hypothetical protein
VRGGATATFLVECYWPALDENQIRASLVHLAREGGVRPIECILVPSDGLALLLLEGPSLAVVRRQSVSAHVPFDRIVGATPIQPEHT